MGLPIDPVSEQDALRVIGERLDAGRGGTVITVNLDFLRSFVMEPGVRPDFGEADLVVADGMPLVWASRLQGTPLPERVTGSNLIWSLSAGAAANGRSAFFLGGTPGTAERAAGVLADAFPGLRVAGTLVPPQGFEAEPAWMRRIEEALEEGAPDIVFVGLPREKALPLIRRLRRRFPRAWLMGVGVTFSFVSEDLTRAPRWVQRAGLEWAHRLVQEPRRLARRYIAEGIPFALLLFAHAFLRGRHDRGRAATHVPPAPPAGVAASPPVEEPLTMPITARRHTDILVVGAGFAGSILAERLASQHDLRVLVIDRRDHIAGNAYDHLDPHGVLVHRYGPHIFHTNAAHVVDHLSRFTDWRPYEHRVLARVDGRLVPIPINRTTINVLYDLDLATDEDAEAFYAERAEPVEMIRTSEDAVVSKVGRDLYEKFFRGYTRKQWQRDPSELHASVTARIPTRTNTDDRYFSDAFQQMPLQGYTAMFERILDHPNIDVRTDTDFFDVRDSISRRHLIYTGPIDAYFERCYGELPYRSLEFELRNVPTPDRGLVQPSGTMNEPSEDVPYTRTTEYRHLTGQVHDSSSLHFEYPRSEGDPFYPIPSDETRATYKRYEALAAREPATTFVGRLARYQYLNMDQVVGQALATYEKLAPALGLDGPASAGRRRRFVREAESTEVSR